MKQYRFIAPVVATALAIVAPMAAERFMTFQPASTPLRLGIVEVPGEYDGAGCRLQLRSDYEKRNDRYIFVSNAEEQGIP